MLLTSFVVCPWPASLPTKCGRERAADVGRGARADGREVDHVAHPRAFGQAARRHAGGELTLKPYPGEDAGFVNRRPDAPATTEAIRDIAAFILEQAAAARR